MTVRANEPVLAERTLRAALNSNPNDGEALAALGALLLEAGRLQEAADVLTRAGSLVRDSREIHFNLGQTRLRLGDYEDALRHFTAARDRASQPHAEILGKIALCYIVLGRGSDAGATLAILNPALPAAAAAVFEEREAAGALGLDTASLRTLATLALVCRKHGALAPVLLELWRRREGTPTAEEMSWLPTVFTRQGKHDEAARAYLDGLASGYPVVDYRPRHDKAALAATGRKYAEAMRPYDRKQFLAGLSAPSAKKRAEPVHVAATSVVTGAADVVAGGGAVLCGVVATGATGARYRFEYGEGPERLEKATDWRPVPPPRTGRVIDRAERMFNHWVPRSTKTGWTGLPSRDGLAPDDVGHMALVLKGPFAKDRNQLNGIGSHEMPLNWVWCHRRYESTPEAKREKNLSVNGGVLDLRDAELTFIIKADDLHQRGAALTFWILSSGADSLGSFWSQWALTGDPFPDEALASDGRWHKVVLNLPNDPRSWTYTGNNPKEQGARANRYRRLPLPYTIAHNDSAFVLIFAHGDERDVPLGTLDVLSIAGKFRDHSLLAPAAGARLAAAPAAAADPAVLTEGSRGYDDGLWTSDPAPAFPLEFRWELPRPVTISSFQINQHPYFPSKDVEILGRTAEGWHTLWSGALPDSASDLLAFPYVYGETTPGPQFTEIRLRILSAYQPERCGLDGFEIFGDGALFTGDGAPCTVAEEVAGLTAGATISFRLVVDEDGAITTGEPHEFAVPATDAPLLFEAIARKRPDNPRCYVVRGNAMGLEAELAGELRLASGEALPGPTFYFGRQPTGRHILYNIPDTWPEAPGTVRLTLRNLRADAVLDLPWPMRDNKGPG